MMQFCQQGTPGVQQSDAEGDEAEHHTAGNWLDASLFSAPGTAVVGVMQSGH